MQEGLDHPGLPPEQTEPTKSRFLSLETFRSSFKAAAHMLKEEEATSGTYTENSEYKARVDDLLKRFEERVEQVRLSPTRQVSEDEFQTWVAEAQGIINSIEPSEE